MMIAWLCNWIYNSLNLAYYDNNWLITWDDRGKPFKRKGKHTTKIYRTERIFEKLSQSLVLVELDDVSAFRKSSQFYTFSLLFPVTFKMVPAALPDWLHNLYQSKWRFCIRNGCFQLRIFNNTRISHFVNTTNLFSKGKCQKLNFQDGYVVWDFTVLLYNRWSFRGRLCY